MRTLAIGDVHGCFDAMLHLIEFAGISESDKVIWLGDYVDRGPDSAKVIDYLSKLDRSRNVFLRGNHEIMMKQALESIDYMRSWAASGGGESWDSYIREFGGDRGIDAVPESHWSFIENLESHYETDQHIFVHAAIDAELKMADQFEKTLFWGSYDSIGPHQSGKHVICGHSSQKDGIPKSRPHATCIDTWACGGAWLTCLDVTSKRYYQANQYGDTNAGWLD